jgi:uncharacterized protein
MGATTIKAIKFGTVQSQLGPAPIQSNSILEGNPIARNQLLSKSADGLASTYFWDCTAGRFNWHYGIDETVYVLEGSVIVRARDGVPQTLKAGDTAFFPAGSSAEWIVESYVRKICFLRTPMSPRMAFLISKLSFVGRAYDKLKRVMGGANLVSAKSTE